MSMFGSIMSKIFNAAESAVGINTASAMPASAAADATAPTSSPTAGLAVFGRHGWTGVTCASDILTARGCGGCADPPWRQAKVAAAIGRRRSSIF